MAYESKIWVLGDPFLDVYRTFSINPTLDDRNYITDIDVRFGGALNVLNNLDFMLENLPKIEVAPYWDNTWELPKLFRDIYPSGISEYWVAPRYWKLVKGDQFFKDIRVSLSDKDKIRPKVLVISDYDKGMISYKKHSIVTSFDDSWKFCIVDSKKSNFDTYPLIEKFPGVTVLRATGKEYAPRFHDKYYDYIVNTNHSGPILYGKTNTKRLQHTYENEAVEIVDSLGCGDVFTAGLTASLARFVAKSSYTGSMKEHPELDVIMSKAINFAATAATETAMQSRTVTTTLKLR